MTCFDPPARIISNLGQGGFCVTSSDRSAGHLNSVTRFSEREQKTRVAAMARPVPTRSHVRRPGDR